jgi:hypothetical protein
VIRGNRSRRFQREHRDCRWSGAKLMGQESIPGNTHAFRNVCIVGKPEVWIANPVTVRSHLMARWHGWPRAMKQRRNRRTSGPKKVLRLLDVEHAVAAVLNSLSSPESQRGYRHAIDEFVDWYCSEPRLAFNRIVVLRYRSHLESRRLAPGTINLRLGAVRRLAYEAADCGLLSSDWVGQPFGGEGKASPSYAIVKDV